MTRTIRSRATARIIVAGAMLALGLTGTGLARAADMEAERLGAEFGGQLAFIGGIDTQDLLVNGTHAVRDKLGDASGERGTIHISTRHDGDVVEIRFRDSGTGIPEEARPHIFEQFYTTKEIGKGTGLGLAIARAVVVEKHGGAIRFETELGEGTTFIVRVPVQHAPAEIEHDVDPVR